MGSRYRAHDDKHGKIAKRRGKSRVAIPIAKTAANPTGCTLLAPA